MRISCTKDFRGRTPKRQWEDVLDVAAFSIFSYTLAYRLQGSLRIAEFLIGRYWSNSFPPATATLSWTQAINRGAARTFSPFLDSNSSLDWSQILFALVCAPLVAFIIAYVHKYRLINRIGQRIQCTRRYGDEDVWEFFQDTCAFGQWLYIRDHKLNLLYFAAIEAFSDTDKGRELILAQATVFSNSNPQAPLYLARKMYISRRRDELTIELPDFSKEKSPPDTNTRPEGHTDAQSIASKHTATMHHNQH